MLLRAGFGISFFLKGLGLTLKSFRRIRSDGGMFLKVRPQRSMFDPVPLIRFTAASSRGKQHADLF